MRKRLDIPPDISIHAPREGSDDKAAYRPPKPCEFQSTPPARGGDVGVLLCVVVVLISIHAPTRGATLVAELPSGRRIFQSTPPARGATRRHEQRLGDTLHFNPRPPRGGATILLALVPDKLHISIHAPREGGDFILWLMHCLSLINFNPRPP